MVRTRWLRIPIERLLVARLRRELQGLPTPAHLGLIMDGNRRWARSVGVGDIRFGHRAGAEHLDRVLTWCAQVGIDAVSVYVLSADNITKRDDEQVRFLFHLLETLIPDRIRRTGGVWELRIAGNLDLVPDTTAHALKEAVDATRGRPRRLTLAVGHDPYGDVVDAVRQVLRRVLAGLSRAGPLTGAAYLRPTGEPPMMPGRSPGERNGDPPMNATGKGNARCVIRSKIRPDRGGHGHDVCMSRLDRITSDPQVCHGQPVVRGLRYPVQMLLELMASGMSTDEILEDYPDLEQDDLLAALEYGALASGGHTVVSVSAA
jgi:uncharacterized protein (DUF433 family)